METYDVIIRTKNSERTIGAVISSIFSQKLVKTNILLVDSGSSDRTIEIINDFNLHVNKIKADEYIPAKVLNNIFEKTKSPFVFIVNSDAPLLSALSFKSLLDSFTEDNVSAVYGRQVAYPDAFPWVKEDLLKEFPCSNSITWQTLSFPLAVIRRDCWKINPFRSPTWGSEDKAWHLKQVSLGSRIIYCPEAVCTHSHNYSLRELIRRKKIDAEADFFFHYSKNNNLFFYLLKWPFKLLRDWTKVIYLCFKQLEVGKILYGLIHRTTQHASYTYYLLMQRFM